MIYKEEKKPRILIVDDTPQNTQILGTILIKEGYQINAARNGLQALNVIEKISPDIILLDVMMPELDGFETCKKLKASSKTRDIPVIFLTARTDMEDIVKGFELGAVDYITKPFNSMELLVRVRTHLELKFSKDTIARISNEREELLHVLCHDLINPFNAMISVMRMANDYSRFELFKEDLLNAAKNGSDIIHLVRNMRALEEYKLEIENISLDYAVSQSTFILRENFLKKNIELEINGYINLNIHAEASSFINSVMNNIFTNAIKFSYPGSKIILNIREIEDDVEISIKDFGIGMPEKLLNDIFDIRKATSRSGTSGEMGTGFGMPLIKKFMKAYGGSINIFSKDEELFPGDHGTEVILRLKRGD